MVKKQDEEQVLEQPSEESQLLYQSMVHNDADEIEILRTKKKYKIRWLKNHQCDKLSRLLLHKKSVGLSSGLDVLGEVLEDSKLACKAAAVITLPGFWRIHLLYWFRWRWFFYIRQYDNIQLDPLLEMGKKKIPLIQFYRTIISLTEAKDSLMRMRAKEVDSTLRGLSMAQHSQTENSGNGL